MHMPAGGDGLVWGLKLTPGKAGKANEGGTPGRDPEKQGGLVAPSQLPQQAPRPDKRNAAQHR